MSKAFAETPIFPFDEWKEKEKPTIIALPSVQVNQKAGTQIITANKGNSIENSISGDLTELLDSVLHYLKKNGLTITNNYQDWINVGFSLINTYKKSPESARSYFHEFSKLDANKYNEQECNKQFDQLNRDTKNKYTISTIIFFAKKRGYEFENSVIGKNLPISTNMLKLQNYSQKYFKTIEEIILFEYFIVKAKAFKYIEFFHSSKTIQMETRIKRSKQKKVIDSFKERGILKVEVKGRPAINYFTVNFNRIIDLQQEIYQDAENSKLYAEISKLNE